MVETISLGARVVVPLPPNAPAIPPRMEFLNPDGSAIPDIIAYHHRPEDLGDMSDQTVPDNVGGSNFFGADGLTFGDFLDIINPLQHIPIVSTIYRALTGDEISPGARIAGGALFGGPVGLAVAIVNATVEVSSGEDIGDTILSALTGDTPDKTVQTAAAPQRPATDVAAPVPDPAVSRVETKPVRLLPQATAAVQRAAAPTRPPIATTALFAGAGLPFGGMGALPFPGAAQTNNDPVAAILQARTAVPMAGPIPGLGNASHGRATHSTSRPVISQTLSDKLSALAAKTGSPSAPPKQADETRSAEPYAAPAARPQFAPQFVPTGAVSQTMLDALDRYQRMKQAETSKLRG